MNDGTVLAICMTAATIVLGAMSMAADPATTPTAPSSTAMVARVKGSNAPPAAPVVTIASKEIVYSFKGLPASMHMKITGQSELARMGVFLPAGYTPEKRYPLIILIQGSEGGQGTDTKFGRSVVGDTNFIVANLPSYKEVVPPLAENDSNHWDRLGIEPADGAYIWRAYRPMLAQLFADFPNIDRTRTVFGGFSNGGNTAAALLTAPESAGEFLAMFRYLVLAEGGWGAAPGASMTDHAVLVMQGGLRKTGRLDEEIVKLKAAGAEVTEYAMEGVEHEYSKAGKERTRQWLADLMNRRLP